MADSAGGGASLSITGQMSGGTKPEVTGDECAAKLLLRQNAELYEWKEKLTDDARL